MAESNSDLNFESVKIGDPLGPQEFHLSKDQVRAYAKTTGMWVPRFTDDEAARKEGLPGMITPGNMSLAILSKLVTDWIGASGAQLTRMGTTYRQPVIPDHTITLEGIERRQRLPVVVYELVRVDPAAQEHALRLRVRPGRHRCTERWLRAPGRNAGQPDSELVGDRLHSPLTVRAVPLRQLVARSKRRPAVLPWRHTRSAPTTRRRSHDATANEG